MKPAEPRIKAMTAALAVLEPSLLEITDNSHLHRGHAGAASGASHFTLKIASPRFAGLNRLACHRLIYQALAAMIPSEIHALQIEIY